MQQSRDAADNASSTEQFERLKALRQRRNTIQGDWQGAMIAKGRTDVDRTLSSTQPDLIESAEQRIID